MKARLESNSTAILSEMLERNWTLEDAVNSTGISRSTLGKSINRDRAISYATAARLRKAFATDTVIRILPPKNG